MRKPVPADRARRWASIGVCAATLVLAAIFAPTAHAHWADQAVAEVIVGRSTVHLTLTLPTGLLAFADSDGDGRLSPDDIAAHQAALTEFFSGHLTMTDGPDPGTLYVKSAAQPPSGIATPAATHTTLDLTFSWPRPLTAVSIRYDLFLPGVPTASCLATIVEGGRMRTFVFTPQNRELTLTVSGTAWMTQLASFVVLGVEHIFTGYDHILFLLSLLMLGGSLRSLVKVVTAFTAAHSITLSLAVLNVVTLPGRWVESAIALSIVYVAAENFLRSDVTLRQRWMVTFGFGLVHGLGFAAILLALHLPRGALASSLVGFNLGVELGQIAIVAVAYLGLQAVRRRSWATPLRRWVSAAAALVGFFWFVQRTFFGS